MSERADWVRVTANYTPQDPETGQGGLPTAAHHLKRRRNHPAQKLSPTNIVGVDQVHEHEPHHTGGQPLTPRLTSLLQILD